MYNRIVWVLSLFFCLNITVLGANIIFVPGDIPTIQEAINSSSDGDTIYVEAGTYVENISYHGKGLLVQSLDGPEVTIIDGSNPSHADSTSCVMFVSGEGSDAIIDGFTLTHGGGVSRGAWGFYGGAVYSDGASPTIRNNVMIGNMPDSYRTPDDTSGGGIYCFYGNPIIERNVIIGHDVSYIGGGIGISFCNAEILNNTIVGNGADWGGGISFWRYTGSIIKNNIIVSSLNGGGIWRGADNPVISYNDVWDNNNVNYLNCDPGIGDISSNPLFVGGDPFDYHLTAGSPCIDAGDPGSPLDPDGTRADMGAYPYDQLSQVDLTVTITPDATVYHRGDVMGFMIRVVNNTNDLVHFDAWTEGETPWGDIFSPQLGPIHAILGPHGDVESHYTQRLPYVIPFGGPYFYRVLVGIYPDDIFDEDEFGFYVVPK